MPRSVFSDAYATFLRRLITARKEAGVTQVELAKRIGREQSFVSLVERGVRRLDVIEFFVIARALKRAPEELYAELVADLPTDIRI